MGQISSRKFSRAQKMKHFWTISIFLDVMKRSWQTEQLSGSCRQISIIFLTLFCPDSWLCFETCPEDFLIYIPRHPGLLWPNLGFHFKSPRKRMHQESFVPTSAILRLEVSPSRASWISVTVSWAFCRGPAGTSLLSSPAGSDTELTVEDHDVKIPSDMRCQSWRQWRSCFERCSGGFTAGCWCWWCWWRAWWRSWQWCFDDGFQDDEKDDGEEDGGDDGSAGDDAKKPSDVNNHEDDDRLNDDDNDDKAGGWRWWREWPSDDDDDADGDTTDDDGQTADWQWWCRKGCWWWLRWRCWWWNLKISKILPSWFVYNNHWSDDDMHDQDGDKLIKMKMMRFMSMITMDLTLMMMGWRCLCRKKWRWF